MSQPPGPYGGPPAGYGPPPGGHPGVFGPPPPPPPPRTNLLPWLIVAGAVLVSGLGILLAVLLTGDDGAEPQAAGSTAITSPSSPSASSSSTSAGRGNTTGDLPGGARVAESTIAGGGRVAGSGDVALTWVQAMADGEFQTAYDLSCAEVQDAADAAAAGEDPAWTLGTYFFEQTLGGDGFAEGTFDGVGYDDASASDVASFTLQLDSGAEFLLLVHVDADGTVCDFR